MIIQLEGQHSIFPALKARQRKFKVIFVKASARKDQFAEVLAEAKMQNVPVKYVSAAELDKLAHGKTHGGVIALCGRKPASPFAELEAILSKSMQPPLLLLLEGVEDAQHLGYILRSAEALGAQAVLLKKHLWNFDETAVARASSGAYERLPLITFSEATEVKQLSRFKIKLWGCLATAKRTIYEIDLTEPVALAVGGEKRGLSGKLRAECHAFVRIPMPSASASSLSLTHAACLLLGEAARQRFIQRK
jgi:23S rRNA (guanosine2251-2'-O)-methyltransferase